MDKIIFDELLEKIEQIQNEAEEFINSVQIIYEPVQGGVLFEISNYRWDIQDHVIQREKKLVGHYNKWYNIAKRVIDEYMPANLDDFISSDNIIVGIIELKRQLWSDDKTELIRELTINIEKQKSIISSIKEMSRKSMLLKRGKIKNFDNSIPQQQSIDISTLIEIKTLMNILVNQNQRIESEIRDLKSNFQNIGRISIQNTNQSSARTGDIDNTNEVVIKWMKPQLDKHLTEISKELETMDVEDNDRKAVEEQIKSIKSDSNPTPRNLKEKLTIIINKLSKVDQFLKNHKELIDIAKSFGSTFVMQ